jgi:putative chitinase
VGRIVGLDLEGDPPLAARNENLLVIAAGFWAWKKINPCCDADDFRQCTILVNGGTVGMEDRRLWLDKARRILAQVPPRGAQPPAATVIAVQRRLQTLGFTQVGAADGDLGRKTVAAIDAFRTLRGLPVGSVEAPIDAALLTALGLAL